MIELTCLAVSGRDSGDTHQALATPEVVARMREMPHRRPAVARPDRLALVIRRR